MSETISNFIETWVIPVVKFYIGFNAVVLLLAFALIAYAIYESWRKR